MSFIRADAHQALLRYREALAGAGILILGLWWAWGALGLIKGMGLALAALGAVILHSGLRRARIGLAHGGVGVVQLEERQITYLAPIGGGFCTLEDLIRVEIGRDRAGLGVWRFHQWGGVLVIPTRAQGAEALFDALNALPGADIDAAISAINAPPDDTLVIWQQGPARLRP